MSCEALLKVTRKTQDGFSNGTQKYDIKNPDGWS